MGHGLIEATAFQSPAQLPKTSRVNFLDSLFMRESWDSGPVMAT